MKPRIAATALGLSLCIGAQAQSWVSAYSSGLQAGSQGHWHQAREDFKQAAANRTDDTARPTYLAGGRKWRNGAPYSPNFLGAYCLYRESLNTKDSSTQTQELKDAANELEKLLLQHQQSRDAYFFLQVIYTRLGDQTKLNDLVGRYSRNAPALTWKVDEELVAPEEVSAMAVGAGTPPNDAPPKPQSPSFPTPQIQAGDLTTGTTGTQLNPISPGLGIGNVPTVPGKFALIFGETSNQIPYATRDVEVVRDGLINYGGYASNNVVAMANPTTAQIMDAAKQLAVRVQQDGVVLIYFVGAGLNREGKDYLISADPGDGQVAKDDLCNQFLVRGARVFTFFEANRPIVDDQFFGAETATMGAVSQMQATVPGANISAVYYDGKPVGLYALSFATVLAELRSNRIPIYEFGWQLFNKMRRGNTGTSSGSSSQTPTLPVRNNLTADARF